MLKKIWLWKKCCAAPDSLSHSSNGISSYTRALWSDLGSGLEKKTNSLRSGAMIAFSFALWGTTQSSESSSDTISIASTLSGSS